MRDQSSERAAIIDEAYRLLDKSGGSAVTVTEVLANTGLSTRAFYRQFQSRDDLLMLMLRRDRDRVLAELQEIADTVSDPVVALRTWITFMFGMLSEPRRRRRVLTFYSEQMQRTPGFAQEMDRASDAEQRLLVQIIARGRTGGGFPDADPIPDARSVRAAIDAGLAEQARMPTDGGPETTAGDVLGFVMRALGASPSR